MESAIAPHLQTERTQNANTPTDYQPPYPAWTARFTPLIKQVVMGYFGIQSAKAISLDALEPITQLFDDVHGPMHWDVATYEDDLGFHNLMAIAYWDSQSQFTAWKASSQFNSWWHSRERENEDYGYFMEVVSPETANFETLFSDPQSPEGVAHLGQGMSDQILEHAYYGSARDRLPIAQTNALTSDSVKPSSTQQGKRIHVSGKDNLCLIRSGQDWSATANTERTKYLAEIEPVLHEGMNFLRDEGDSVGCLSCRYMKVLDSQSGALKEQTFGLAHFNSLAELETWAKTHPTHVAIFGGFMRYVQELEFNVALKLYHEIAVIPKEAQFFEYINCHPKSGLLRNLAKESL